jgi:carbamoyl-phosphate synthase small subunit
MKLILEDGTEFAGRALGAPLSAAGEVVFNTGMSGFPEAFTDPSYAGQILVMTYPLVGNYGVPGPGPARDTGLQSGRVQILGLVTQQLSAHFSHHRSDRSLVDWLASEGVPILDGVDTRALTQHLRERGTIGGVLAPDGMSAAEARANAVTVEMRSEVFRKVAPAEAVKVSSGELDIVLIDVGAKNGISDCLVQRGAGVTIVPWHQDFLKYAQGADGIIIGNGPGDPTDLPSVAERVRQLMASFHGPLFGVCLGHQILARAAGFDTFKLRYGHRGVNQPVQDVTTGRCYVTSQNHGYAVAHERLTADWETWFVNLNDGTNEGIRHRERPIRSVQFHPEGRPGPLDTEFLFDDFLTSAAQLRKART